MTEGRPLSAEVTGVMQSRRAAKRLAHPKSQSELIARDYAKGLSGDFPVRSQASIRREDKERRHRAEQLQGIGGIRVGDGFGLVE